jgi:MFS family permease
MVGVGIICMMIPFGIPISVLPLVYNEAMKEFGWTMTQATFAFSLKQWTAAAMALFVVAPFVARFGLRALMMLSFTVTGLAMASFLLIHSMLSYNLAILSLGVGQSFTILGVQILVSRWFTRRQGLALGIALAGSSLGGSLFPLAYSYLIADMGWRSGMAVLSLGIWLIAVPIYLLFARENPTAEQIAPDAVAVDPARVAKDIDSGPAFSEIVRKGSFWAAAAGIAITSAVDGGLFQHTALYIERDVGMSKAAAAGALSATFALGVFSKIFAGWVFDRLSIRGVQMWWLMIAAAVMLAFSVQGAMTLAIFALVRGVAHGGLIADNAILAKHAYGPRAMTTVLAMYVFFYSVGGGIGPLLLSACYDHFHNYTVGFFLLTGLCLFATALLFFVPSTYRRMVLGSTR